ncbi:MAG TPA: hypothetical protein VEI97_18795 [bacterium]|nr:hypothetical protein [bacterium]
MTDINTLNLREPDPIAADSYVDGGGSKIVPIPPKGEYTLRTAAVEWGATREGYLQATLTETVVAPGKPFDGHEVRFDRINTKKWPNREGSSMADYLRAHGIVDLPRDNAGYMATVNALVGRTHEAGGDWEAFKEGSVNLKGMENFPQGPGGERQDWVPDPSEPGKKLYARFRVSYRKSKVASAKAPF